MTQAETQQLETLLGSFDDARSNLIAILQEVQTTYYYLPQSVLRRVAEKLDVPLTEIYHVATFYNCFSLEPVGKHLVQVCLGTACHVRGGPRVLDRILRDLKLGVPGTTNDYNFTVRTVRCIGCCGLAPVATVDNKVHHHLTQAKAALMLKKYGSNGKPSKGSAGEAEDA